MVFFPTNQEVKNMYGQTNDSIITFTFLCYGNK